MERLRSDVRYDGIRILRALARGHGQATPLYARYRNRINRRPSYILLWSSLRLRLPARNVKDKTRYKSEHGYWDGRTTIRPCVLNAFWQPVKPTDPDYQLILGMDRDQHHEYGVIFTRKGLKILTYQHVEDLAHGLRQPDHVMAQYDEEKARLQASLATSQLKLRQARLGGVTLATDAQGQLIEQTIQDSARLWEIDQIYEDRALRKIRLVDFLRQSVAQLRAFAESLTEYSLQVADIHGPSRLQIEWVLRDLQDQISIYSTSDVRDKTHQAVRLLRQIRLRLGTGDIDPHEVKLKLQEAARLVEEASATLTFRPVQMTLSLPA